MTVPNQTPAHLDPVSHNSLLAAAIAAVVAYEDSESFRADGSPKASKWVAFGRNESMLSRSLVQDRTRGFR